MSTSHLVILRDGATLKTFPLTLPLEGELILGRAKDCALRLDDQAVSRHHAALQWSGNQLQVIRRSDFAPLIVNGAECQDAVLKEGDMLSIGPYLVRVILGAPVEEKKEAPPAPALVETPPLEKPEELAAPDPFAIPENEGMESLNPDALAAGESQNPAAAPEAGGPESLDPNLGIDLGSEGVAVEVAAGEGLDGSLEQLPGSDGSEKTSIFEEAEESAETKAISSGKIDAKLKLTSGEANVSEFQLKKGEVSIGRSKNCDIVITDKKASRKNTVIIREGAKFLIKDLDSVNGTYVNGNRIKQHELTSDDVIRIGNVEFAFEALSSDYLRKEKDFMPVLEEEPEAPNPAMDAAGFGGGDQLQQHQVPITMQQPQAVPNMPQGDFGAMGGMGAIPGIAGMPGGETQPKGLFEKFKKAPPLTRILIIIIMAGGGYWLMEPEEVPVVTKKATTQKAQANPNPTGSPKLSISFEALTPDQKQFVEAQHNLAFDYYKNKDYDKALFEIQKIFTLVDNYSDSREIERYAKEGKRRVDAIEEERRKKEEDDKLKTRITHLIEEASGLMNKKFYPQAKEVFSQIVALDPENTLVEKWTKEIDAHEEQIKIEKQQKQVQADINRQGWTVFHEAAHLQKSGKYHSAITVFERILDIGAAQKKLLQQTKDRIVQCHNAIKNLRDPVLTEAKELEKSGEFSKAFALFKKATQIDPPHPGGYAGMNRVKGVLHDRAKAVYTEAILAESYSDFSGAEKMFKHCLEIAPADDIYYQRAERKLARYFKKPEETSHQ